MKTTYFNDRNGHTAETRTETDQNGQFWELTTMKRYNGKISSTVKQMTDEGNGLVSYLMCGDKSQTLLTVEGKATEKKIKEVHEAAIIKFQEFLTQQPTQTEVYKIEIGQIIFTYGYEEQRRRAVYEIPTPGKFKTVLLDGSNTSTDQHVKSFKEKFGIGNYYNEGDKISLEEVNELLNKARRAKQERAELEVRERAEAEAKTAKKIEEGKKIIDSIPNGVTHVILGVRVTTTFDPYADYNSFTDHTEEVIYLSWSRHGRDLFDEMRKAADKDDRTKHLGTGKNIFTAYQINTSETAFCIAGEHNHPKAGLRHSTKSPEFFTRQDVEQWISEQNEPEVRTADDGRQINFIWHINEESIEHREKYSMGSGYYLRAGHTGNWKIRKATMPSLETLQIAAAEGRLACNHASPDFYKAGNGKTQPTTTTEAPNFEKVEVQPGQVQIIDYSEKAIAVIGDTKPIKDKLSKLGGKFNPRLTCGPGWIFPKSRLAQIQKALTPEPTPDPETIPEEPTQEEAEAIAQETERLSLPFPELEPSHPLNLCNPQGGQYKEALKEYRAQSEGTREAARIPIEEEHPNFNYAG